MKEPTHRVPLPFVDSICYRRYTHHPTVLETVALSELLSDPEVRNKSQECVPFIQKLNREKNAVNISVKA